MKCFFFLLLLFPNILFSQVQWTIPVTGNYLLEEKNDTLIKGEFILNPDSSFSYQFSFIDLNCQVFSVLTDTNLAGNGFGTKPEKIVSASDGFIAAVASQTSPSQNIKSTYLKFDFAGNLNWSFQL